jgi:hypothetical protein
LCWIVGEYTSNSLIAITPDVLNDYNEALELFAYERLSLIKLGISRVDDTTGSKSSSESKSVDVQYTTRLMLVIISALSKLAARWQPLTSRVMLCLAKILRHDEYMDETVITRTNECITLLKFPRYFNDGK